MIVCMHDSAGFCPHSSDARTAILVQKHIDIGIQSFHTSDGMICALQISTANQLLSLIKGLTA